MAASSRPPSFSQRLGRGLRLPLAPEGGRLHWVEGPEVVAQSIRAILLTEPGERIGRPELGCGLRRFLFAPNTVATRTLIRDAVSEALARFEPRVNLEAVDVLTDRQEETRLELHIRYRLKGSPGTSNLVFPFYLDRPLT